MMIFSIVFYIKKSVCLKYFNKYKKNNFVPKFLPFLLKIIALKKYNIWEKKGKILLVGSLN